MGWIVIWQVVSGGPIGQREDDGSGIIYQGETVRFSIRPEPSQPHYLNIIRQAEQARAWESPPQMTVIGESRGRTVRVPVRHLPDNLLVFEYQFRYEGNKTLRFEGTPAVYDVGSLSTHSSGRGRPEAAFDPLRVELQVRVQPHQIGRDAQSMEGRSERYRRSVEDLEGLRERLRAGDPEARQLEEESRDRDDEEQRAQRSAARPASSASEGVRRAYRSGLLNYELKHEIEVGRMSGHQLDEYLSGLEAAIRITPGFRMYAAGRGSRAIGQIRATDRWDVEYRPERNQIAFFVTGNLSGTSRMTSRGFEHTYPTAESRRRYRESQRTDTLRIFPDNAWIILQTSADPGSKSLIHVRQLAQMIELERFWQTVDGMVTLGSLMLTAGISRPAVLAAEIGYEILSRVLLPPEAQLVLAGASMTRGVIIGLRSLVRMGASAVRRLRSARGMAGAGEGSTVIVPRVGGRVVAGEVDVGRGAARGTSLESRGTVPPGTGSGGGGNGGSGGSPGSSSGIGRRRPVYRGPQRAVEGFHDLDGRAIEGGERVSRSSGEILGDLSSREYRVAQAIGRDGREVIRLPNQAEWDSLIRQQGWSRERVRRLMQRVREAQQRDGLLTTRNPDLLVNGRVWDIITQGVRGDLDAGVRSSLNTLIDKGIGRQTRRVVVDFTGYSARVPDIRRAFRESLEALATQQPLRVRQFNQFIDEVAITVGERVYTIYSRGQGISF